MAFDDVACDTALRPWDIIPSLPGGSVGCGVGGGEVLLTFNSARSLSILASKAFMDSLTCKS